MVDEGANGFVVSEKDVKSIAEKLNVLISNHALRESMAKKSREILLQKFTTGSMVDNVEKVYKNITR